ncbi:MAG TPA: alpha/beta fold hydrolase, partial [Phycisphaerales bacterium]|nr:alpha/beta fold hydrolase [Phycisphaerales bacterium]
RAARVRAVLPQIDVKGRTVIIVSQGLATGAKMLAAVTSVRNRGARKIIAAAPAGTNKATWALHEAADLVVVPHRPVEDRGVEKLYKQYTAVSDDMMISVLEKWVGDHAVASPDMKTLALHVRGTLGQTLSCDLDLPPGMRKGGGPYPAVIFAHGFESSSRSPRNMAISRRCAHQNIIGVRMDFTGHGKSGGTAQHATEEQMLHDLDIVARAVANINEVDPRRIGVVGSGTGATVALRYAGMQQDLKCIIIRGPVGVTNIESLRKIKAPTLVIHGEKDIDLDATVQGIDHELTGPHRVLRIAESNRLFNDPISLELMVSSTVEWLVDHLKPTGASKHQSHAQQSNTTTAQEVNA